MAADNRMLGKFGLDGIPPAPRGVPQIEVTFDIDANGIVNVSAKDKATSKAQHITITASSGLSEAEIQRMVKDAAEHEAEDKKRREAIEARNKLEALTFQVQKHLDDNRDKIAEGDRLELEAALKEAKETVENNRDPKEAAPFEGAFERLQKASHKMAEALYRSAAGAAAKVAEARRRRRRGRRGGRRRRRQLRQEGRRHRRRVHRRPEEPRRSRSTAPAEGVESPVRCRAASVTALELALVFAAYAATARLGLSFDALGGIATTVWPPTGIALAALILRGPRLWPAVARRGARGQPRDRHPDLGRRDHRGGQHAGGARRRHVCCAGSGSTRGWPACATCCCWSFPAALGSTLISATFGLAAATLSGVKPADSYPAFWAVWWIGDAMGDLLIAPLICVWAVAGRAAVAAPAALDGSGAAGGGADAGQPGGVSPAASRCAPSSWCAGPTPSCRCSSGRRCASSSAGSPPRWCWLRSSR